MSLCFEARTASGPLHLRVPAEPGGDAVAAALALAAHEPLIGVLEGWLQQALDPTPLAAGDDAGGSSNDPPRSLDPLHRPASTVWVDAHGVQIGLSWPLLLAASAPPPVLPWSWPALRIEIEVAAFDTPPLPPDATAGMLLLPPAFEPAWRVALHIDTPALLAEAEWRGPGSDVVLCAPPEPAPVGPARTAGWHVLLEAPLEWPLSGLLGWAAGSSPARPGPAARLVGPHGMVRHGRIAPALAGAALWLDD